MIFSTTISTKNTKNNFMNKLITKLLVGVLFVLATSGGALGQVTVTNPSNTTPALSATYSTLALAIADVNNTTAISGPVTITLDASTPQTAPAGGYSITAIPTGASSVNNIIFDGGGNTITAYTPQTTGILYDAIFKLIGADFITIQNFTMQENGGNTVTTAASNTMTEWGVALLYATTTNGAQNNTIQNNSITLNRAYSNTFGIYSNVRHSSTAPTTTADITTAAGSNFGNKVYTNTISNVNDGIVFVGSSTAAAMDNGNDVGGSSAGTGNTITNWGGIVSGAISSYPSVSASNSCIYMNHQINENVSYNTLTSATNITTITTQSFLGIFKTYSAGQPTGTITANYNNNTITLTNTGATTSQMTCMAMQTLSTALSTATFNCNNNNIINCTVSGASATSASILGMLHSSGAGTFNITGNTIRGFSTSATSGGFTGIQQQTTGVVTALNIDNNKLGDATAGFGTFTNATNSGTVTGISVTSTGAAATCALSISSNDVRGIVHNTQGTGANTYINSPAGTLSQNISSNTFTNLNILSTGSVTFISHSSTMAATGTQTINNNSIVTAFNKTGAGGTVTCITTNGSSPNGTTSNVTNNNFSNITVTGATAITGINNTDGASSSPAKICTGNTFNNWTGGTSAIIGIKYTYIGATTSNIQTNTVTNLTGQSTITGITIGSSFSGATTLNISNNIVSNLSSTGSGGSVTGIENSNTSTSINIYKNKISDLSTTATTSLVAGLTISGSGTNLNVYNNLIGNLTASAGNNSTTDVVRGINITSASTSSINLFYNTIYLAGTSSAADFASSGIFHTYSATATIASLLLKNNIIANTCTAKGVGKTSALRRSAATDLANFSTSSSNNLYYGSTLYFDGTNSDVTMAAFSTRVGARATASFTENPTFISTTASSVDFLHINTTTPTQIESGGTPISSPISITDDYDAVTRDVTTPDVGADEGTFTIAVPMSYTSSTTEQLTGFAYAGAINQSIIRVQIVTTGATSPLSLTSLTLNANGTTDIADINAATAKVYYTGASTTFGTSSLFGATTPTVANFTVTGSQTLVEGNNYFWLAYDVASAATSANLIDGECIDLTVGTVQTPTVSAPSGNKSILGAMSGTYAVGASQTENGSAFTTLTTAIADLNSRGVSGAVIFALQSDYSSATETFPLTINAITGASGTNTVTIKPASTVTATITGSSSSSSIIKLNGADYVTIDGSNSGGSTKNLTITNSATTAPTVISIASLGTGLGATNNTVKNCNINTGVQTSIGYGISVGGSTPGTSGADNDDVTIQNNNITTCAVGIYAIGSTEVTAGGDDNLNINGNSIDYNGTLSNVFAIKVGNILAGSISDNNITMETTLAKVVGISLETGANTTSVTKNKISKCKATGSATISYARGIVVGTSLASSLISISNNVIYNVATAYATTTTGGNAMGIMIGAIGDNTTYSVVTGGIDLYFNSVNLSGTYDRNSACTVDALFLGSAVSAINLKNNAFKNSTLNTNASPSTSKSYAIYCQSANTAFTAIDYNDYYVSGSQGVLGFLGSDRVDLAGIQAGFGQNVNSIVTDPLFNSNTNLIPQPGSPVLGAGTAIGGITIDYLGTTRNNPPTIGAYETAVDEVAPVITYTALSSTCLTTDITLTATITDASGVPTAGVLMPRIYYKKDAGAWFSSQGVLSSGTATNGTWTFTIVAADMGGVANPNVISYYVIAQDIVSPINITSNPSAGLVATDVNTVSTAPTTPNTYTIQNTLAAGTYTVGAGQTYTTLTAAITAYNTSCLGGAVIFNLMDATYASETFPITINANADASATNTLTIKPASGVTASISGTSAVAIFKLNGADYVIIDGSNSGSTSKDLTITNTNTGTSSAVVWLGSASVSNGATNNTIKNCIITGNAPTTTYAGIISSSGTTIGAAAEIANANNTYNNNTVNTAYYGIWVVGPTGNESGTVISGNLIGSATAGNKIGAIGIPIYNQSGVSVTGNTIFGVTTATTATASGIYVYGTQSGGTISGNNISDIKNTNTGGYLANGIFLASTSTTAAISVYNNFIFDIAGYGYTSDSEDNGYGIVLYSGGGYNLYNNTINMNTNQTTGYSAAVYITSSLVTAASVNIRNNIFANTQTAGAADGKRYAIYCAAANTIFGTINHNDYYSSGTHLGYIGSNRTTLAEVVTGFGGNANSISTLPTFTSATDLHLTTANCTIDNKGTVISSVTTDIDNQTRDLVTPDMGADEFSSAASSTLYNTSSTTITDTRTVASLQVFRAPNCERFAALDPTGASPVSGSVTARVYKYATVQTYNSEPYVQRVIDITPATGASSATGIVTLYYTQTEFDNFNTANGAWPDLPTGPTDATGIANLRITKYAGTPTATPSAPGTSNYSGGTSQSIDPVDADIVWNVTDSRWEITLNNTGFSGFYIHTGLIPLAISVNYLTGTKQGTNHNLNWKVTCTNSPSATMVLERSGNNRGFMAITTITADAVRCAQPFNYVDASPLVGINYYRLRITDAFGKVTYSNTIAMVNKQTGIDIVGIVPNPVTNNSVAILNVASAQKGILRLVVTDVTGRQLMVQTEAIIAGSNQLPLNVAKLAAGSYQVTAITEDGKSTSVRFIKQ